MAGYQIKITLKGAKPPVWRRLAVPDRLSFGSLHLIIQEAFGWDDAHYHDFTFEGTKLSVGTSSSLLAEYEENEILADDFFKAGWICYTYDFSEDWRHIIVLEKELADYKLRYPKLIKYRGNNFIERSGGAKKGVRLEDYDSGFAQRMMERYCQCPETPEARSAEELGICLKKPEEEQALGEWEEQQAASSENLEKAPIASAKEPLTLLVRKIRQSAGIEIKTETGQTRDELDSFYAGHADSAQWAAVKTEELMADFLLRRGEKELTAICIAMADEPDPEFGLAELAGKPEKREAGNPETEARNSETEAGNPETEPKNSETEAGNPETEPGNPEAEPGNPETEPENLEGEPEKSEAEPEWESRLELLAEWAADNLKAHPHYLSLIFSAEELETYVEWHKGKTGRELPDQGFLRRLMRWGLAEAEVQPLGQQGEQEFLAIALPQDAECLALWLGEQDLLQMQGTCSQVWEKIGRFLLRSGIRTMEGVKLRCRTSGTGVPWEEMVRYLGMKGHLELEETARINK